MRIVIRSLAFIYLLYEKSFREIAVEESPKGSADHNHHGTFLMQLRYLSNRRLYQKYRYYKLFMRTTARSIGLSAYDVKNGAIGSSLICPFYLPKNKGTTNYVRGPLREALVYPLMM